MRLEETATVAGLELAGQQELEPAVRLAEARKLGLVGQLLEQLLTEQAPSR